MVCALLQAVNNQREFGGDILGDTVEHHVSEAVSTQHTMFSKVRKLL